MNRKGFSLIELLAAIVILTLISTIIVISFDKVFEKNDEKKYQAFKGEVESAACVYIDLNKNKELRDSCYKNCTIKASDLIEAGLINEELNDPSTETAIDQNLQINITWDSSEVKTCSIIGVD